MLPIFSFKVSKSKVFNNEITLFLLTFMLQSSKLWSSETLKVLNNKTTFLTYKTTFLTFKPWSSKVLNKKATLFNFGGRKLKTKIWIFKVLAHPKHPGACRCMGSAWTFWWRAQCGSGQKCGPEIIKNR